MSSATCCGPVWEFADWIHFSFARLASALPFPGFSSPVSPTVVPYPPSIAYVPDASDRCLGLHRDSCRSSVIFVLGEQRPDHACHLVGERDRDKHARLSSQHTLQPRACRCTEPASLTHHRAATDDQQSPYRSLTHLRNASKPLFAAGRVLAWCEAEPGGEVTALAERLDRWSQRDDGRRRDRTDLWGW